MAGKFGLLRNLQSLSNWLRSTPVLVLLVGFACVGTLLLLPVWTVPGIYYWDVVFWLDAAHRIDYGQMPNVDFFAAFGPLPQYGLWLMQKIFPSAHPILAAQLFYAVLGLPLLALILADVRSRLHSILLAGAFIGLLLLPANFFMKGFNFGFDIGIYNRQAGLLLYLLVAGIWWCRSPTRLVIVVSCTLLCLLFTKITAFSAASALAFYAFLMGRISARGLVAIVIVIGVAVWILEIATGMVSDYMRDIGTMMGLATSSASSRQEQDALHRLAFTIYYSFDILVPVGLMIVAAFVRDRHVFANALSIARNNRLEALRTILQADGIAISVLLAAAMVIESQNSGSQEFAFLIPAVWYVMVRPASRDFTACAVIVLAAAFLFIVAVKGTHRAILITSHVDRFPRVEASELKPFHLSARPADVAFADAKLSFYSAQQNTYAEFASRGQDLAPNIDEGFQLSYFLSVRNAVRAVRRWQTEYNVQLKSIAALDFVDPFPTLLNLKPVVGLGIVMDPYRAAGQWTTILRSLSTTDGILVPLCPVTDYRYQYAKKAKLEIESRRAISIDPCWTLYVK
jgi:hypothetical protein